MSNDNLTTKLAEIEARADAATPGPWELKQGSGFVIEGKSGYITRDVCRLDGSTMSAFEQKANAELIANASQDIYALLRLVKEMRKQRDMDVNLYIRHMEKNPKHADEIIKQRDQAALEAMLREEP
jgi:hypothetical protein